MIYWFKQQIYSLQIRLLLAFRPAILFHKINQLEWYRETLNQWINGHGFNFNINILEVGCATGTLSEYLSECAYVPTGVDESMAMIEIARSRTHDVDYHAADVCSLPFEQGKFDCVVSSSLINIVSNPKKAIGEMARVCKRGGTISILVPAQGFTDDDLRDLAFSLCVSDFSEAALRAWHKSAPKMNVDGVKALLEKTGLTTAPPISYLQGMVVSISATKVV